MSSFITSRAAIAAASSLILGSMAFAAPPKPLTPPSPAKAICTKPPLPAGFAAAARQNKGALTSFPESDGTDESEGWVRLGFTIDAEGATKDIVILDRVGPQSMTRAARLAVARWKYKPATENGVAVEQYGNSVELLFRRQNVGNTAVHDEVVQKFDEARVLVTAGKYAEGISVLEQMLEKPLTLYEQAKVSFALAFAYEKSKDMPRALGHVRHALIEGGSFLEKAVVPAAQRLRMRLEAANGNLVHTACAPPLPATDSFDPTGADLKETSQVVDAARQRLAANTPLLIEATLMANPAVERGGIWEHTLSRGTFKFGSLIGLVNEFRLTCMRQVSTGPVGDTPITVPPAAGSCTLRVYGEIGAAFKLTEEW